MDVRDLNAEDRINLFITEMQRLGVTGVLNKIPGAIDEVDKQLKRIKGVL